MEIWTGTEWQPEENNPSPPESLNLDGFGCPDVFLCQVLMKGNVNVRGGFQDQAVNFKPSVREAPGLV